MSANANKRDFSDNTKGLTSPASLHELVPASTQKLWTPQNSPRSIRCDAAGTVVLKDAAGTEVPYNVLQSEPLPVEGFTELVNTTNIAVQLWW